MIFIIILLSVLIHWTSITIADGDDWKYIRSMCYMSTQSGIDCPSGSVISNIPSIQSSTNNIPTIVSYTSTLPSIRYTLCQISLPLYLHWNHWLIILNQIQTIYQACIPMLYRQYQALNLKWMMLNKKYLQLN